MNSKHNDLVRKIAIAAILDGRLPCALHGTVTQVEAFSRALYATRTFDSALATGADLQEVSEKLKVKRAAAAHFKRVFGVTWPA